MATALTRRVFLATASGLAAVVASTLRLLSDFPIYSTKMWPPREEREPATDGPVHLRMSIESYTMQRETCKMEKAVSRFGELSVQRFRRLQDVRLALRPLSVLIGANGMGKTSILDVLSLLANSAQGKLSSSISELSGLANVLTYDRNDELHLGITMQIPHHEPIEYSVRIQPQGIAYAIQEETLIQVREAKKSPFRHIDSRGQYIRYFDPEKKKLVPPTWDTIRSRYRFHRCRRCFRSQRISGASSPLQPFITFSM
jgi:hypothetical protein